MLNAVVNRHLKNTLQTIVYLPHFVSWVVISGLIFSLFDTNSGAIYNFFKLLGIELNVFSNNAQFLALIVLSDIWKEVGWGAIIYLAALTNISPEYYEAARIDGANTVQQFFRITLPMISPAIFFQLVMGVVGALQVFNQAALMTDGGPQRATYFYVYFIYQEAFVNYNMGYASALAWLLFLIVLVITVFLVRYVGRTVYYEAE